MISDRVAFSDVGVASAASVVAFASAFVVAAVVVVVLKVELPQIRLRSLRSQYYQ